LKNNKNRVFPYGLSLFIKNWGAVLGGDISADSVNIVENLQSLLSRFFSGESENQGHLILYPWHNDSPYVMEQYLLHTAGYSLLASSGGVSL